MRWAWLRGTKPLTKRVGRCTIKDEEGAGLQTAGGQPHRPRGGEAYADYVTYRTVHSHDYRETQKPPPRPVTVSSKEI